MRTLLVELANDHYESLVDNVNPTSPLYDRLKKGVRVLPGIIAVLCDANEAAMLLHEAKQSCPAIVPLIEGVIKNVS